jgi:hypothetical protein
MAQSEDDTSACQLVYKTKQNKKFKQKHPAFVAVNCVSVFLPRLQIGTKDYVFVIGISFD